MLLSQKNSHLQKKISFYTNVAVLFVWEQPKKSFHLNFKTKLKRKSKKSSLSVNSENNYHFFLQTFFNHLQREWQHLSFVKVQIITLFKQFNVTKHVQYGSKSCNNAKSFTCYIHKALSDKTTIWIERKPKHLKYQANCITFPRV